MTITVKQRERRRKGIGGSDAPAIVGASPYATPLKVWLDKKGELEPDKPNGPMQLGNALEPYIAEQWHNRTGLEIYTPEDTIVSPSHPFLFAHPDRLLHDRDEGLECKLVINRQDDWGPPDSDLVPPYVHIQCDHYLLVTGFKRWHVAAQIGLRECRIYTIERDEALLERLLKWESAFWDMVQNNVRPPMMNPADIDRMFENDAGTAITADAPTVDALAALRFVRGESDAWKALADVTEAQVKGFMGENGVLTDEMATPLATWKKSRDGKKFDLDRFRVAHPDLFAQFQKPAEGSRRFLLKI